MTYRPIFASVLICVLMLACGSSFANSLSPTGGMGLNYGRGTVTMVDGGDFSRLLNRAYIPQGSVVRATESYRLLAGGSLIDVTAARSLALGPITSAAIGLGGAAWVGFNAGAPIAKALGHDTFDLGDQKCTATNTGWQCQEMEDATGGGTVLGYCESAGVNCHATALAATQAYANGRCAQYGGTATAVTYSPTTTNGSIWEGDYSYTCQWGGPFTGSIGGTRGDVAGGSSCPASIDALNPAWSVPAGTPPGGDGKCPTGRYTGASIANIIARVAPHITPQIGADLVPEILARGAPIPTEGPRELTGPGSAPAPGVGSTVTTTNPDGSTVTVSTPPGTNNYTYNGPTITITNNTTTTTTTNNGGNTTTTTTTNEGDDPKEDPKDPCEGKADLIACTRIGDPPTGGPQWETRDVPPFEAEDLGFGGSCPAPFVVPFQGGQSLSFSYAPICDMASWIKALILAITTLNCAWLIVQQTTQV